MFVRRRLVFDEHINITTPGRGFKTVEHVAELLTEIIFDERSGFQLLCAEISDGAQTCWQVELHKITGYIRLCQKLSERRIVWRGRRAFFIIRLGSDPEKRTCIRYHVTRCLFARMYCRLSVIFCSVPFPQMFWFQMAIFTEADIH